MEKAHYYDHLVAPYHATIAASAGLVHNIRYRSALRITPPETGRYNRKTRNLALCYAGFVQERFSHKQALGAGKAAFLSCAYDVASDWHKGISVIAPFEDIADREVSPKLAGMAVDLLYRDLQDKLTYDGLERGIVATRFILELMGLEELFEEKTDVDALGIHLQIVDDVMDYKEDHLAGDQNCLDTIRCNQYLESLLVHFDDPYTKSLFPYGGVLTLAITKARQEARNMLQNPSEYFSDR